MRIKNGFVLRNICGEDVVIAEGKENIDFNNIISLNETASYIWKNIIDTDFTIKDITDLILKEYDIDEATAQTDSTALINQWMEIGIIK